MKTVFADSFYFFALVNARDPAYGKATGFLRSYQGLIVTTGWIVTELGDGMAHPTNRPSFLTMVDTLGAERNVRIVPCNEELLHAAIELYRRRPAKSWSLTDCTSFVVMQRESITDALTADHHFEQAGFVALLK
jgi:hypothetical protein